MSVMGDVNGVRATGEIWGWVLDTEAPDTPQMVRIAIGDHEFDVIADTHRPDIAKGFSCKGNNGFVFAPPVTLPGGHYDVRVLALPGATLLPRGSFEVNIGANGDGRVRARISSFTTKRITGWAYEPEDPSRGLLLDMMVDHKLARKVPCEIVRKDVDGQQGAELRAGFHTALPIEFWDGETHRVTLKDTRSGQLIHDGWLRTDMAKIATPFGAIYGEVTECSATGVAGWVTDGTRSLVVELEVDDVLIARQDAVEPVQLDTRRAAGFRFHALEATFFDDQVHRVSVFARAKERVLIAATNLQLSAAHAPRLEGEISAAKDGKLSGWARDPSAPDMPLELSLLVDGAEMQTVTTRTSGDTIGAFEFLLPPSPAGDSWLRTQIEVVSLARGIGLAYEGRHPVLDSLEARVVQGKRGEFTVTLTSGVVLPSRLKAELMQDDEVKHVMELIAEPDQFSAKTQLLKVPATGFANLTHMRIGSAFVPLTGLPGVGEVATQSKGSAGRIPGASVPALDVRVRRRLSDLARRQVTPEGDVAKPDYSGVWRFVQPATVEGWAVDLSNPSDPLEVELVVDNVPTQRTFASHLVSPREAHVRFDLPVGFRFDLSTLRITKSTAQVEVRMVGGGKLPPGKPQLVDVGALRLKIGSIAEIDALVEAKRLTEAYFKARFVAQSNEPPHIHRFLALDFVLRASWHDYERFLAAWGDFAGRRFLTALTEASRLLLNEGTPPNEEIAAKGELPVGIYGPLLAGATAPGKLVDLPRAFDQIALWNTLTQLPPDEDARPRLDQVALVLTGAAAEPGSETYEATLTHLAASGCALVRVPKDVKDVAAATQLLAAASKGRSCFVVLRAPRLLPEQAIGFWPALLAAHGPGPASLMRLPNRPTTPLRTFFVGRTHDAASVICGDIGSAARAASGEDIALPDPQSEFLLGLAIAPDAAGTGPSCVIFHDLDGDQAPEAPQNAKAIAIAAPGDGDQSATAFAAAWAGLKASPDIARDTPIIFMSRLYQYPPDYVARCLREFALAGRRSVVTSGLSFNPDRREFTLSSSPGVQAFYIGLRERGCYRFSDLLTTDERHPGLVDGGLVAAVDQPFKLVSEGDSAVALVNDAAAKPVLRTLATSIMMCEVGFWASVLAGWAGAAEARGMGPLPLRPDDVTLASAMAMGGNDVRAMVETPGFFQKVQEIAARGHHGVAEAFMRGRIEDPAEVLKLNDEGLIGFLECVKALGLQEHVNRHLFAHLPGLLNRSPRVIMPLFENMAMSLSPADLTAVLIAGAALILQDRNARSVYRLISASRRYCSGSAMVLLVDMIRLSQHKDVLKDSSVAETIGSALLSADPACRASGERLMGPSFPPFNPPLIDRIIAALIEGDAEHFPALLNAYFIARGSVGQLVQRLRTYTYEITQMRLSPGLVRYPPYATHKEALALAIVLDDSAAIRRLDGAGLDHLESTDDAHGIVAATYHRNMRPLEQAFRRWGADCSIAPVSFAGEDIEGLFAHLASQPLPPPAAEDHGRVSVILTVYNPVMPLLELALASIERQTYRNFEIILVDDASDLQSAQDIEKLAQGKEHVKFLRMARNAGPYVCRNRALEIATGAFVAIHDGDDYAHPQRLEAQVRELLRAPVLKLSTACHLRIDQLARLQFEHTLDILGDGTMTSVFRRDVFDVIGGFAPVRSRGDVEFRERLKLTYGPHVHTHLACPLTFCFATPASLSNSVMRTLPDYLALFREAFAKRIRIPVVNGGRVTSGVDTVCIPWPMRSENLPS